MIRKCMKVLGAVAAILVGVVAVYVIYLFTSYHRIADNLPLTVEQPAKKGDGCGCACDWNGVYRTDI